MLALSGVQFFPVTPFDHAGDLAPGPFAEHLERGIEAGPGAVFVACGTGEFHTLSPSEHQVVVQSAVRVAAGRVPVVAGTGGPVSAAVEIASNAERAGADGLLVLPPYLAPTEPAGLVRYVQTIAAATGLPMIVYNRPEALLDSSAAVQIASIDNVVGLKDGLGNLDLLSRLRSDVDHHLDGLEKPFQYFNGLPTAETSAIAYQALGIDTYSSAVFGFVPEVSLAFRDALVARNTKRTSALLEEFFLPFARLRSTLVGGAISLVKAGVNLSGIEVGGVRPPLMDAPPEAVSRLREIIASGLACLDAAAA